MYIYTIVRVREYGDDDIMLTTLRRTQYNFGLHELCELAIQR